MWTVAESGSSASEESRSLIESAGSDFACGAAAADSETEPERAGVAEGSAWADCSAAADGAVEADDADCPQTPLRRSGTEGTDRADRQET